MDQLYQLIDLARLTVPSNRTHPHTSKKPTKYGPSSPKPLQHDLEECIDHIGEGVGEHHRGQIQSGNRARRLAL
jgi:hypothetical protein